MKKALCYFMVMVTILAAIVLPTETFQAADVTLGISSSSVKIGNTVTVTVTVPDTVTGNLSLIFPTDVLEFSSSSSTVSTNGGTVQISMGKYGLAATNTVTITFKAKTSGTATVSTQAGEFYNNDTLEEVILGDASATITVANETTDTTETTKSGVNALSSLKLSSGTLSPSFQYNVTNYTATVGYNVTSITVDAKVYNAKATIDSVTGNGSPISLSVGENTIQVVVKAENGVKCTYTVVVTRLAEGEGEVTETPESGEGLAIEDVLKWNNQQYSLPTAIPEDIIPVDFTQNSIMICNTEVPCFNFDKGNLTVLCLENANGANELFVYDQQTQSIYPFIKIQTENSYVFILMPDEETVAAPEGTQSCTFTIEGKGLVYAYQFVGGTQETETTTEEDAETGWLDIFAPETFYAAEATISDFYLVYCMDVNGETGWYIYDSVEGTVQRYCAELVAQGSVSVAATTDLQAQNTLLNSQLNTLKLVAIILAVVAVVLFIFFIIVLVLFLRSRSKDDSDEDKDDEDVEIEFIEDTKAVNLADEITETDEISEEDEIEIEFYEMEVAEEDEIEIEFYEMTKEDILPASELDSKDEDDAVDDGDDDEDDDLEFINL